ncbi:MAG TPA: serine/threonine-protein kinase [Terriglobales bacterium]|nr:serine/threonine-protein kinase [Terriglobales bacterium]
MQPPDPNQDATVHDLPTLAGSGPRTIPGPVQELDATLASHPHSVAATPGCAPSAFSDSQSRVGSYTITGRLGEGGMGVVYEAMQDNPRRPVALKIIRGAFADEQAVRMFQREAQVLGRLRHPGIAAIYESGRTPDGQHYFAMELVRGRRLDEYVRGLPQDQSKAVLRQKLRLFLLICDAVSYAHQRGVIHRDLKPANVLVHEPEAVSVSTLTPSTVAESQGGVKVLDFGLARITEDELGGASLATQPGTIQGTVPYMSPEQVRGVTDQIDVRSDVYALGVIFFEMLAGALPYDLRKASLPEAARIICEQPPQPLPQALPRELNTIVFKALEKAPALRYQSVAALADDVHRYLSDQPILAQPPSAIYQLRKLVTRHKLGFSAATAMVVLLAGFAVAMTVQAGRIAVQRDRANQESAFLTHLFQVSKPDQSRGRTITARELLDGGAKSIQADKTMDREVKASLLDTMGGAYSSLGMFDQSRPLLDTALALRTAQFGANSVEVAQTLRDRGLLKLNAGDEAGAQADYQRALGLYQHAEAPASANIAQLLNDVGTALERGGQLESAEEYFQRALDMGIKLNGPNSKDLIPVRTNLAVAAYSRKDYAGAEQAFRQELAAAIQIYGPDHPFVSKITNNLGGVLYTEKKYSDAEHFYSQALALNRKLLGDQHPEIGVDLENIAEARDSQDDLAGAEQDYRQAIAVLTPKVQPGDPRLRFAVTNLGSVLVRESGTAKLNEAETILRAALAADQKALPAGAWEIADVQSELGAALLEQRRYSDAEPLLTGSFSTLQAKLGTNDPATVTRALDRIVRLYQEWGKPDRARPYLALRKN